MEALTLGAVTMILIKELFSLASDKHRKNTKALEMNTHAIIRLQSELEHLQKMIERVPKIEKDLNEAHYKLRTLEVKFGGNS